MVYYKSIFCYKIRMFVLEDELKQIVKLRSNVLCCPFMCSLECLLYQSAELLEVGAACVWLESVCVCAHKMQ